MGRELRGTYVHAELADPVRIATVRFEIVSERTNPQRDASN